MLLSVMGSPLRPEYKPPRKVNAVLAAAGIGRQRPREQLGFQTAIPLEQGLRSLVAWWQRAALGGPTMKPSLRDIPFARPEFDQRRSARRRRRAGERLGEPGPRGRALRGAVRRAGRRAATASPRRRAPRRCISRSSLAGVGPGDEVICPSYSFIATANAVLYAGATPVFADIERDTWNIDPRGCAAAACRRGRQAILPVHQVGLAADLDRLERRRPRHLDRRGRGLRHRVDLSRPPDRLARPHRLLQLPSAQDDVDRRRRHDHDRRRGDRRARARSCGRTAPACPRCRGTRRKGVVFEEYRELGFNYRHVRRAGGDRHRAAAESSIDCWRGGARSPIATTARSRPLAQVQVPARPPYAEHAFQSYAACC